MARMPEVQTAQTPTAWATTPQVYINGKLQGQITCSACDNVMGIVPGKALLQIHQDSLTLQGPITLNGMSWTGELRYGARVKVCSGSDVFFLGTLLNRQDQGSRDAIVWTALDDRWILSRIPLRGALVYDGGYIKFFSRYTPRTNPGGRWNCMGVSYGGQVYPVFSAFAEQKKDWQSTTDNFGTTLGDGELGPWTPRRWLQYLRLLMYIERDGWNKLTHYRNLEKSLRIEWPVGAAEFGTLSGSSPNTDGDPLDKKMPDVKFAGSVLQALGRALKIAGTHDLQMQLVGDKSRIVFANVGTMPEGAMDMPIIRGGTPPDTDTAFDFQLHENAEETAESVLVEGEPERVESRFVYVPGQTTNTIKPAWTATEEQYFKHCIWGAASGASMGEWALIPATVGAAPSVACNGASGRPYAPAGTADAVAVARKCYPSVFVEYVVDSTQAIAATILGETIERPTYSGARPILPEQLQHVRIGTDYLTKRCEIRVQVCADNETTKFYDAPHADGLKVGPYSILLAGLAEQADGQVYCTYKGSLLTAPWDATARALWINLAVPRDQVVSAAAELTAEDPGELDPSLLLEFNGPVQEYVPGGGFRRDSQFQSRPSALQAWENTGDATTQDTTDGITGYVMPGDETPQAQAAADRLLKKKRFIERRSSWKMVGIRPDFRSGMWIAKVKIRNGAAGDQDYPLKAPVMSVAYDFLGQETLVGGLVSLIPTQRSPAAAVARAEPGAGAVDDSTARRPGDGSALA